VNPYLRIEVEAEFADCGLPGGRTAWEAMAEKAWQNRHASDVAYEWDRAARMEQSPAYRATRIEQVRQADQRRRARERREREEEAIRRRGGFRQAVLDWTR
jgi:hypothetical protein